MKNYIKPLTIGSASTLIAIASLISYGLGLVRDRMIAVNFGTTSEADAYNSSFLIPDLLFNLFIAGALMAAFMPIFAKHLSEDKQEADRIGSLMITIGTLFIGFLAIICAIFMKSIISFTFSGIPAEMQNDIVNMTRLMLISSIFFTVSNTLGNILMSYKHFFSYAISPVVYNLGIIIGVISFNEKFGIYSAAIGVVIGSFLHMIIRLLDLKQTDFSFKPNTDIKNPSFKKILKLMIPKSIGLISWQLNLFLFSIVGIKLIEGGWAAFNYARNIQSFAVSLFGISLATAVFPYLSASVAEKKIELFTEQIQDTIQRTLFFTIPAAFGLAIMSKPLVSMILQGGIFQEKSITLTSLILVYFAFSIPFESMVHTLARGFYAFQNTLTPMIINLFSMAIIAFSTLFMAMRFGIEWFSIGFTVGYSTQVILLFWLLRRKFQNFNYKKFIISSSKILISTAIMSILLFYSKNLTEYGDERLINLIRIAGGATIYFVMASILKIQELKSINIVLKRVINKSGKTPQT